MAKNPERIDRMVELIKKKWKANPDLRLCQLLGNCFDTLDLYYVEDSDLEKQLKEVYREEQRDED
jgi:uncharacterized protein YihD (DUF1040 family)